MSYPRYVPCLDVYRDIDAYLRYEDEMVARLPRCRRCGEIIRRDTTTFVEDDELCDECLAEYY